jgi:hypothetical protein
VAPFTDEKVQSLCAAAHVDLQTQERVLRLFYRKCEASNQGAKLGTRAITTTARGVVQSQVIFPRNYMQGRWLWYVCHGGLSTASSEYIARRHISQTVA